MSISFQTNSNSNEELLIRALVDDIYQIEEKINSIYDKISKNDLQNESLQKIEELKNCRNSLLQQKIKLNDSLISEIKTNSNIIQQKQNLIKDIDDKITAMKNELINNFNTLSFKSLKLKKYILLNKSNNFLSEKQINDIIFDPPNDSKNPDVQKLRREIAVNKASENVIINNYNEIKAKIAQIEENLKMLKEEKMTIKCEIINLISCKESLESIIKLNINQLNIHNKLKNENDEKNKTDGKDVLSSNIWTKPNELFIYELMVIDSNKAANNICNQLFSLFNINTEGDNNNNETINEIKNRNKNNKTINTYKTVENYATINNNYINQNKSVNELFKYQFNNNDNNQSFNNYNSIYLRNNYNSINYNNSNINSILNKNNIINFIKNELDKFIAGEIYSYKTIYEFLENLSIIIISKFQYANIIIAADTLTIYLSYAFKSLYYESIINSKLQFINKDYKTIKKNYKKMIPCLYAESSKLDTKYQEYKSKIQIIEKQIKLIQKENINQNKTKKNKPEKIKLTNEEKNYIQICTKANGLIQQKKNIEKTINNYENKKTKLIKDNELMVNKLNDEINNIDKEIVDINKEIKNEKNKANKDIDDYKEIINEKYNIIKEQLQIYKDKYGSNLDIYNRLINSINNTIKRSHTKQPLIIINNNNNINNSNIFSYDINNNINNKENISIDSKNNNNKNINDLLLFPNENIINNEFNEDIIDNNNINKELFNIGFDISRIEKSSYVPIPNINSKEINNLSINNNSIINQIENKKPRTIREQNIEKINERRRVSKALSNVESFYKLNNKNPSLEYISKTNLIKNKNNSINTDIKDRKNNTFYSSSISGKINKKKKKEKIKNNYINKTNDDNSITNINCTSERRYDKYNKYYNNYYKKNSKILTYKITNNSFNKPKYQSYSFIKPTKKILDSNSIKKNKDSNFHNSITKKKLGLFSNKDEKEQKINLNKSTNNNNINFLNVKELTKLTHTLQNLKDTISQRNKISYKSSHFTDQNALNNQKFVEKVKLLKKSTFCYYRESNQNSHKFNPLIDVSLNIICQSPYNFIPANISLNDILNQIEISPIDEKMDKILLNIIDIENTIVSSKIKLIVEVHRNFRKYKESSKFKSVEDFVERQMAKNPQLTSGEIDQCARNKNFNFSLLINGGKLIELIICSYEEFKQWINGLAFLIKNKNVMA